MSRAELIERVVDQIASASAHPAGIAGLMMDSEIAAGGAPYTVSEEDWVSGSVVARRGREVRIVAVLAKHPGSGSLRRLVEQIEGEALTPVIVAPVGSIMPTILKHWRWSCTWRGRGWERVDEWRPPSPRRTRHQPKERPR